MPVLLLVRHGQASFGAADYDVLSAVGRRQAEMVAASLAERGYHPARLLSGTLRRQRETAAAFAALGGPEIEIEEEPRWDEFDPDDVLTHHSDSALRLQANGAAEPLTNASFQAALEPALAAWIAHAEHSSTAQTWPQFSGAGTAALSDLATELTPGQTAVVVTSDKAVYSYAKTCGASVLRAHEWNALERRFVAGTKEKATREKPEREDDVEGWLKKFGG